VGATWDRSRDDDDDDTRRRTRAMESYRQKFIQTGKFAPMKHFMVRARREVARATTTTNERTRDSFATMWRRARRAGGSREDANAWVRVAND
jgi:hypothetical protein